MPTETITITVTGANPQTKTVAVNVDTTTGTGSTSVTFTGVNGGQDTFNATATIASTPYTSNNAFVAWQPTNGTVSLASNLTVAGYVNPGESPTWHGVGTQYGILTSKNTVVINQVYTNGTAGTGVPIVGLTTDDGNPGQLKHTPPLLDDVKSDGTALTALGTALGWGQGAAGDGSFVTFLQGQLVVAASGVQTFYFLVDDSWALYVGGGASYVAGAYTTSPGGGAPASPSTAIAAASGTSLTGVGTWPLLGTRNTPAIEVQPTDYVYVNFPNAGIYPFLAWFVNDADAQTYFQMTYAAGSSAIPPASGNGESGGVIKPVALQAAPPATTPAGNLQLSLAQSNVQIQGNQITVNVGVSGIVYPNKQYIPLFEGHSGKLFIYNNPGHTYNFQTYNGQPVDPASAAANTFTLSGNSQSLLSIAYNNASDGQFSLVYAGTPFPAGIAASTQLTVTAEDIAWFNSVNKTYDSFVPASVGGPGAISFSVEVDYMTNPATVAVSPSSVPADGTVHVFTVTLSEPMSPQQVGTGGKTTNTVTPAFTSDSGTSVQSGITAQFNTSGFLTGYTVPISVPFSTSNGGFNLHSSLTGTLSYLSGTAFVNNGPVTYLGGGVSTAIGLSGAGFQPPVAYAFSISPNDTNLVNGPYTLTGTAYTLDNNAMTMNFIYNSGSGDQTIGAGTLQSMNSGTISGQTVYFSTFTFSGWTPPSQSSGTTDSIGFIATDTASTQSVKYYSTTTYSFPITITYGVTLLQTAVAQFFSGGNGNPAVAAFASPITAGNIIVVSYNEFDNSSKFPNIVDLYGNAGGFFQAAPGSYNSQEQYTTIYVGYAFNTGPCQLEFQNLGGHIANADNNAMASICAEFSGINNPAHTDGSNGFNQGGQNSFSFSTGAFTTSNPNDVIFSASPLNGGQPIGWSFVQGGNGYPSSWTAGLAWTVVTAAGTYNPTWVNRMSSGTSCALTLAPQQ